MKVENDLDNDRLSDEGVDDEEDEENEKETTKKQKLNKKTKVKAVKRLGSQLKQKSKYWLLRRTCLYYKPFLILIYWVYAKRIKF